jgi:hypothetical protein
MFAPTNVGDDVAQGIDLRVEIKEVFGGVDCRAGRRHSKIASLAWFA